MKWTVHLLFVGLMLLVFNQQSEAQDLPDVLKKVLQQDTAFYQLSCKMEIEVDVSGLNMPNKEIELTLEKGKKPKIKSKGLIILPKRGIIGQYREFLNVPVQTILMETIADTSVYKIVSLHKKTDWVTVDIKVTELDARVHSLLIASRKAGEFLVRHFYAEDQTFFPARTIIQFEAMPLKLPLKFLGQNNDVEKYAGDDGPVSGQVILYYSEIEFTTTPEKH